MSRPAVRAIARWEWSRRWRALLVIGILGGIAGGLITAGAALTRRTVTAPERLIDATSPGDVHLRVFGTLTDELIALPQVRDAWRGGVSVGRVDSFGGLAYSGVIAPVEDSSLFRPVVIDGRAAHQDDPDEVVLVEDMSDASGLRPGDHLQMSMLSAQEVSEFDTGFGEPDGPDLDLTITGIIRVPTGVFAGSPVVATRAFADAHADLFAGEDLYLSLRRGARDVAAFTAAADELAQKEAASAGVSDFPVLAIDSPRAKTDDLTRSSRVLVGGLLAAVLIAALAVGAALAQVWARHHSSGAETQSIESALGLPSRRRVMARLLPAGVAAAIAAAIAGAIGTAASGLQPVGGLRRVEPHIGWRFDAAVVVLGALATGAMMLFLAASTAWRAGRRTLEGMTAGRSARRRWLPRRRGWPLAGATFALSSGGVRRHVPVRLALLGGVLGVTGIVGSTTFAASLDRLTDTPERYGWKVDFLAADVTDDIVARFVADPNVAAVTAVKSATFDVAGHDATGYEITMRTGDPAVAMWSGRLPTATDEVLIGPRLARQIGAHVGDVVPVQGMPLRVVGIGLLPTSGNEVMGTAFVLGPGAFAEIAPTNAFREALVRIDPSADRDAVIGSYGDIELQVREMPREVRSVADLGSLPSVLGVFLAVLAAVALIHALVVTIRQRSHDLAVLRALGATPRESGLSIVTMAVVTAGFGIVVGVPLGYLLGRLLWGEIADSISVRDDVITAPRTVAELLAVIAVAVLLALIPARRASRVDPGQVLRAN